ncbi:MAG: blue light sensor protein [Burkholderiales bacterium PBB5]|nr:MAG: blue light sensor protein [Burkholderiales bacterium PBB5]
MLVRLLYASRVAPQVDADGLQAILRQCKEHNPSLGITGLLCHCPASGIFMQALEGGRSAVNKLYNRIAQDPRHGEVVLLSYEEITERRFAGWAMGLVNMSRLNPALLLKYSATAELNPYAVSGEASLALFDELVATASVLGERG